MATFDSNGEDRNGQGIQQAGTSDKLEFTPCILPAFTLFSPVTSSVAWVY
jgi:hypothetical protein